MLNKMERKERDSESVILNVLNQYLAILI